MTDRELMQQALWALENSVDLVNEQAENAHDLYGDYPARRARIQGLKEAARKHTNAITALRERLAQPEQALNLDPTPISGWGRQSVGMSIPKTEPAQPEQSPLDRMAENARELGLDYEPEQEPVALETVYETIIQWDEGGGKRSRRELARRIVALYTTPPRREWVGLTLDDMEELAVSKEWLAGTRWAEAKLKEKNDA